MLWLTCSLTPSLPQPYTWALTVWNRTLFMLHTTLQATASLQELKEASKQSSLNSATTFRMAGFIRSQRSCVLPSQTEALLLE